VDNKRNENAIAGVAWLNIPVVNKSATAEVKKVESEVAAALWCHSTSATVDRLSEVVKAWKTQHHILSFMVQVDLVYF